MSAAQRRNLLLVIGFLGMLGAGALYAWSVFVPELKLEFGWDDSQTSLVFTVAIIAFDIGCFMSGTLYGKLGPKPIMVFALVGIVAGLVLSSMASSHLWMMLSFGLVFGSGGGALYNSLLGVVVRWFPEKSGFCSGALLLGFGLGAMVFGQVISFVSAFAGWRGAFIALAGIVGAGAALVLLTVRAPSREELESLPVRTGGNAAELGESLTTPEMLRNRQFWTYNIRAIVLIAGGLAVMGNAVPISLELGIVQSMAVLSSGLISVFNGASRLGMGIMFDKLGLRKTMWVDATLFVAAFALLALAARTQSQVFVWAAYVILGLAYGGMASNHPVFILNTFGSRNYSMNLGTFALINSLCSPVSQLLGGTLATALGSFGATFPVLVVASALGLASTALLSGKPARPVEE